MTEIEINHTRLDALEYVYSKYLQGWSVFDITARTSFSPDQINDIIDYLNKLSYYNEKNKEHKNT